MIKRLVYNKKAFKILDGFTIKQSNAEVTFNDITIDFTGYSLLDIPFKYQELKIIQAETEEEILNENGEVVFAGFLDDIDLSEMKIRKEEQRELTLTVLSPLAMSTKRYVSLIGTYSKEEAIRRVLQPLLDDGFKIVEFNIPTGQITTNFVIESVENCMNDMCFKAGVFWFIDENKNIYINSIDYLFGLGSKKTIAPDVITKGLSKIQPKIENIDYANVINFKNVRIYYSTMSMCDELNNLIEEHDYPLLNLPKKLKKGDTVQFNNPIVVSEDTLRKLREEGEVDDADVASLSIIIGGEEFYIRIETNEKSADYDKYVTSNNFSFSDDGGEEKTLVLQRDSFFNNLITGFKWNGADNSVVSRIYTGTALRYTTMRFMHSAEINNLKGVISDTGIVEKCIDYQEKWTTTTQLVDYARSLMSSNTKTINQVDLTFDETPNLKIGDIVEIHEPDFYIDGKFAVKEISYKYINDENEEWNIKLKNSDLNSTYIDLFRPAQKQENESKTDTVVLSEYVEETVYEKHEIGEKETLTGEVIVVKDNDGLITIERINSSHSQKTTEGRNVFNPKITTRTNKGITVSQEGKYRVKINGKATGSQRIEFDTIPNFEQGKYYTVTIKKISGSCTKVSDATTWGILFFPETVDAGRLTFYPTDTVKSFTFQAIDSNTKPYFWQGWEGTSVVGTNSVFNNLILEISIVEGTTAKDYEDYTGGKPSPNPNYPQENETVGNNINILPGKEHWEQGSVDNKTGEPFSSTTRLRNKGFIGVEPKTNYFASLQNDDYAFVNIILYDNKGTYIKGYYSINNAIKGAKALLIAIPENCYNIKAILRNADDTSNITVDEYPQIRAKFEKGDIQTPYSAYNQGSVEVIKRNRNQFDIAEQTRVNNGTTSNYKDGTFSLVGTATMNWTLLTQSKTPFYLKAGEYTVSVYDFNVEENYSLEFTLYHADNTSTKMYLDKYNKHRTYTVEKDVTGLTVGLSGFKAGDTLDLEFSVQLEEGKTSKNWILPRSEEFIVPIQREMLEGDYIDTVEHHEWHKLILTGTEPWYCETNGRFGYLSQNLPKAYKKTIQISDLLGNVCNSYIEKTPAQTWKGTQGFCIDPGGSLRIWDDSYSKTSDLAGFKAMLSEKYNAGNPVVCYLKLATPIELELTDEQKAISKYLQPYDNGTTILVTDKLATITASYTKKGENDEN